MDLIKNEQKRPMHAWDYHDHGGSLDALRAVRDRLIPHRCEFGTSQHGEMIVRREDGLCTVYLAALSGGRWWLGARERQVTELESWDEMVEFRRDRRFLRERGPDAA